MVDTKTIQTIDSPSGHFRLVVTSWDVGATASTAYHFALVNPGILSSDSTEVLIVDKVSNETQINVAWMSDGEVSISIPEARVFESVSSVEVGGQKFKLNLRISKIVE